ncbi:hypothetical protein QJS04_geneDACA006449 [Acorus gramineus]|uniref:Uncharacterized protein n=1 Tax=Acorus gramineus TaxID=55184 RepID=A0AAV9AUP1_ACOGR|nr:hypothetical protein QJS04_geneDACA006449 [Acorus gramineus]
MGWVNRFRMYLGRLFLEAMQYGQWYMLTFVEVGATILVYLGFLLILVRSWTLI